MTATPAPLASQCVILAGGLGTRLGSLAGEGPKPLAAVGERPFLDHLLARAHRYGYSKLLILAGHRSGSVVEYAKSRATAEMTIEVSIEPRPLGTGGALRFAHDRLDERFVMMNGDSLFDFDWRRLEVEGKAYEAAIALVWAQDVSRFGVVGLDGAEVSTFGSAGGAGGGLINGGVYALSRNVAVAAPECGSLERDVFPELVARRALAGVRFDAFFIDIGVPEDFRRAQYALPGTWTQAQRSPLPASPEFLIPRPT